VNRSRLPKRGSLRAAWVWFALIPLTQFVFALFRAGTGGSARDLMLVEMWADGVGWLLLGLSLLCLTDLFGDPDHTNAEPGAPPEPPSAAPTQSGSKTMKPEPQSEARAASGGR